ncbi:hypothetical protein [Caenimonas sedimenti]|nr:hypothetical protein [Caenimonas sedimenti]
MDVLIAVPDGLTWLAAGGVGTFALVSLARMLEAMLDLEVR